MTKNTRFALRPLTLSLLLAPLGLAACNNNDATETADETAGETAGEGGEGHSATAEDEGNEEDSADADADASASADAGDGDGDAEAEAGDGDADAGDGDAGDGDAGDGDADAGDGDAGDGDAGDGDAGDGDADTGDGDADAGDGDAGDGDAGDGDAGDGDGPNWDPIVIDLPVCLDASQGQALLIDATVSGGNGDYSYSWSPTDTVVDPTVEDAQVSPQGTVTYNLEVTDSAMNVGSEGVTVHVADKAWDMQADCQLVEWADGSGSPDPVWTYADAGTTVCESENALGGAHLCPVEFTHARLTGSFEVDDDDDDTIGLLWGYQNPNQFYAFMWKKDLQDSGHATYCPSEEIPAGMAIKRVDGTDVDSFDIICVEDTVNSSLLLGPDQITTAGWEAGVTYDFELVHDGAESTITVRRADDQSVVATATINDATFPEGFAGPFSHSQPNVCTSNWRTSCV